jgi:hypothetical protein
MVNRLSVNVLLKSVIAIMGAAVMTALVLSAWDSWSRLQIANQIAIAADGNAIFFPIGNRSTVGSRRCARRKYRR